ncbi:arsenate reductase/protein-tyrosine-phosphatase family protein [Embleya sp. NPDC001921]
MTSLLFVCTGNATRSVIAGELARTARPEWRVATAGTFVVEGLPISWRTRAALERLGLSAAGHRSTQLTDAHVAAADLLITQEYQHVRYIRRHHPEGAARTATLRRLVRDLPAAGPAGESLAHRLAALDLASVELEPDWEDVVDPGGGEEADFVACAHELAALMADLIPRLGERVPSP